MSHYDAAQVHPLTDDPTKYQPPAPCSFQDIAQKRFYRSRSLRQDQRSNKGRTMTLHTNTPNQCPYQVNNVSTSYTLWFLRYTPDKLFPTARLPTCPSKHHG